MDIEAATLVFNEAGIPVSEHYGDVYHAASGAVAQAKHVFLAGNGLPDRWRGKKRFVILETGFGLGINFLTTWQAWLVDEQRCDELDFISVEKHPFHAKDMKKALQNIPVFDGLADEMLRDWPALTRGEHRIDFSQGRVHLYLYWGEANEILSGLKTKVDAFYLDGFSPAVNTQMWSAPLFMNLSRYSHEQTTLATWSVAGSVRRGLKEAGFSVDKRTGFAEKRQMLTGIFSGKSGN